MSESAHDTRVRIAQYHFVDGLSPSQISQQIPGTKQSTIRMICTRAKQRAKSPDIDHILGCVDPAPWSGRPASSAKPRLSCERCTRRKARCDKLSPCSNCTKAHVSCVPVERQRLPRGRHSASQRQTPSVHGSRDDGHPDEDTTLSTPNIETYQDLVTLESPLQDSSRSVGVAGNGRDKQRPDLPLEAPLTSLSYSLLSAHASIPSPASFVTTLEYEGSAQIRAQLCAIYNFNVDPIFKVLHKPSITAHITQGHPYLGRSSSDQNVQALDYAVFFAAVSSLGGDECMSMFGVAKSRVVEGYRAASEAALGSADFVLNHNLVILQAFVIHLAATRVTDKSHRVWTLLSLALRMAQNIGLLENSAITNVRPFEKEQRRRLLMAIGLLDAQAALEKASEPMIIEAWLPPSVVPLNINDADISLSTTEEVTARQDFTDSTFLVLTSKTQILARFLCFSASPNPQANEWKERQSRLNTFQQEIAPLFATNNLETMNSAWYWYTKSTAECIVAWMQLLTVRPLRQQIGRSAPVVHHADLLKLAVKVLEETRKIVRDPRGIPWRWYGGFFAPWHALAVSLAELCVCDDTYLLEACWPIIQVSFFRMNDIVPEHNGESVWEPMLRLMRRAEQKMESIKSRGAGIIALGLAIQLGSEQGESQQSFVAEDLTPPWIPPNDSGNQPPTGDVFDIWPDLRDSTVNLMTDMSSTSADEIAWASWEDFINDLNQTDGVMAFS